MNKKQFILLLTLLVGITLTVSGTEVIHNGVAKGGVYDTPVSGNQAQSYFFNYNQSRPDAMYIESRTWYKNDSQGIWTCWDLDTALCDVGQVPGGCFGTSSTYVDLGGGAPYFWVTSWFPYLFGNDPTPSYPEFYSAYLNPAAATKYWFYGGSNTDLTQSGLTCPTP